MISLLRLINKIGQVIYGPLAAVGGVLATLGVWYVAIVPALWFTGIVVSQVVYGRCVILESISRLKKKLPKTDKAHEYLFKDYNPEPKKVKGLEILNPYEAENLKKTIVCHAVKRRRADRRSNDKCPSLVHQGT